MLVMIDIIPKNQLHIQFYKLNSNWGWFMALGLGNGLPHFLINFCWCIPKDRKYFTEPLLSYEFTFLSFWGCYILIHSSIFILMTAAHFLTRGHCKSGGARLFVPVAAHTLRVFFSRCQTSAFKAWPVDTVEKKAWTCVLKSSRLYMEVSLKYYSSIFDG